MFQDYQIAALKVVWKGKDGGVTSRDVYLQLMEDLEGMRKISRASIINFLNSMCDEGVLSYEEETCKGGTRRRYSPVLNEEGCMKYIARSVIESFSKTSLSRPLRRCASLLAQERTTFPGCDEQPLK